MIRLDKLLAHSGYGSRKEVKELIRKGYVTVNEVVIKNDDFKVDETNDEVIVDGVIIDYQKYIYSSDGSGILNLCISEMLANGMKYSDSDYEQIQFLEQYVKENMNRWEYVQASNYSNGEKQKGNLGSLQSQLESDIQTMKANKLYVTSDILGGIVKGLAWVDLSGVLSGKLAEEYAMEVLNDDM